MSTTATTTCDHCQKDLTHAGFRPDYRLTLTCDQMPPAGTVMGLVYVQPWFDGTRYFCGPACLKEWLDGKMEDSLRG